MKSLLRIIVKALILICFVVAVIFLMSSKYEQIGECTAITYYHPLAWWDYCIVALIAVVCWLLSYRFLRANKIIMVLEGAVYLILVISLCTLGNRMLEYPSIHWPHEYHPQPIGPKAETNYSDRNLFGCWERTDYEESSDSVTFLSPLIEFSDDNMFANGDTLFYYTYHLQHDTLTIHRPNNAMQKYKILRLTRGDFTVKLLYDEIFSFFGPSEITDSVTISFKRVPNTYVAKKPLPNIDL